MQIIFVFVCVDIAFQARGVYLVACCRSFFFNSRILLVASINHLQIHQKLLLCVMIASDSAISYTCWYYWDNLLGSRWYRIQYQESTVLNSCLLQLWCIFFLISIVSEDQWFFSSYLLEVTGFDIFEMLHWSSFQTRQ